MPELLGTEVGPPENNVSTPPKPPSQLRQFLEKLLIFVILFMIYMNGTISGYYLGVKTSEQEHKNLQETLTFYLLKKPVTPKAPQSTPFPSISNWKTYNNAIYHFQLQYPIDLTTNSAGEIFPAESGHDKDFNIRILSIMPNYDSYNSWLTDQLTNGSFQKVIENKPIDSLTLSGNVIEVVGIENHTIKHAFIKTSDNKVIDIQAIDGGNAFGIFDQILSTFQFTK